MVANKPGHQGERGVSRKLSRRESRSDPVDPVVLPRAFFARTHGCDRHPAFPAPSAFEEGRRMMHNSGGSRRENADPYPDRCLTFESEKLDQPRAAIYLRHAEEAARRPSRSATTTAGAVHPSRQAPRAPQDDGSERSAGGRCDSRISNNRRPSPFSNFFTALEAMTSPWLA